MFLKGNKMTSRKLLLYFTFGVCVCVCLPSSDPQVRAYPMGEYDSMLSERGSTTPRRVNVDSYLRSYLHKPAFYLLSVARATQMVETHCQHEEPPKVRLTRAGGKKGCWEPGNL